jgi:hypothetical protein
VTAALMPLRRRPSERVLRPTLPDLWVFLAIAMPALASLIVTLPTTDLAYQLRAGADILGGSGIPSRDAWTFTAAGLPWLDQQWGAQVFLAAVYGAAGWTGLAILRAAMVGLVSGLILLAIRLRAPGIGARRAAWLTLGAFIVSAPALALRPQLAAMVCFALALALLAGRRRHATAIWLVPVVAIAWANLHGSFILAPALAGLAWIEDLAEHMPSARRALLATGLTLAATLVNPFGPDVWRYAASIATNREVTARISEWQPTTPTDVPGILFWASVVLVAVGFVLLSRRRGAVAWPAILGLVAFAALGAVAVRGIAWWPGVAVVTLAGLAAPAVELRAVPPPTQHGSPLNALVGAAIVLAGIAVLPSWRSLDPDLGAPAGLLALAPPGVTAALRDAVTPGDRVWNPQPWGSWFEFAVPDATYALDSRIELIPPATWADGDVVTSAGAGWEAILDRYGVAIVVTDGPSSLPLPAALAASGRWRPVHADDAGAVWTTTGASGAAAAGLSSRS